MHTVVRISFIAITAAALSLMLSATAVLADQGGPGGVSPSAVTSAGPP